MRPADAFTRICLLAIVVLLSVIVYRQNVRHIVGGEDTEYFIAYENLAGSRKSFLDLSAELTATRNAVNGRLHTITSTGMGTGWVAVFEVPKGTISRVQAEVKK